MVSTDMVNVIIQVFHFHVYALLDRRSTLSFVTPFIIVDFCVNKKILTEPFSVSTLIDSSIIAKRVYKNFPVIISPKVTSVDLVEFDMTNFMLLFVWTGSTLSIF